MSPQYRHNLFLILIYDVFGSAYYIYQYYINVLDPTFIYSQWWMGFKEFGYIFAHIFYFYDWMKMVEIMYLLNAGFNWITLASYKIY